MKVLIFGSSLARDLKYFDQEACKYICAIRFKFVHRYYSGKSFEFMKANPKCIEDALSCKPDFVLVIFGANSISTDVEKNQC